MTNESSIIRSILLKRIGEKALTIDDCIIGHFSKAFEIKKGVPPEKGRTRKVKILEDTDGKLIAKSISLYNILTVSFYDFRDLIIKQSIAFLAEDKQILLVLSMFNLIHEFTPKLVNDFNEQDAKVLLAIFQLNKMKFSVDELYEVVSRLEGEQIVESAVLRSINHLLKMRVIRRQEGNIYKLKQKMVYHRR